MKLAPNTSIILCFDRSCEYLASIIGVWKAGAIYVPIDSNMVEQRISRIIKELFNSCIVITDKKYKIKSKKY